MREIIKPVIDGKQRIIKLPDREGTMAIREKIDLLESRNPYLVAKFRNKQPVGAEIVKYNRESVELDYWIYQQCEIDGMKADDWSTVAEACGRAARIRITQGPPESRPVTINDLTRLIGELLLSSGEHTEKTEEILKLTDTIRETLGIEQPEQRISEADLNGDPTQTGA